jgi:two-component system response regulator
MTDDTVDVLLVEDNLADAELILLSLTGEMPSARVYLAHDGVEALDFLFCRDAFAGRDFEHPPRLVLMDLKMPKVDGLSVLRQIKSDPRTRAIPVVMLTSSNLDRDVTAAYGLGVNSYVQKPMEFPRLRETVGTIGRYWLGVNEGLPPGSPGQAS